ncbi:GGDEF domain-containing phosphodiesterase [Sulfurimonas sp. C5]|uniref:putative bifunctional diguanylate cyclase/phosphodiesterase n=1 Tax=Sulfurimonas sp. C5 TaxID=3036947 RepID=UPI0024564308|nr:GGDEF domain-containing phosphodiesterase [Sulfurimonas sp. C5]MDH4944017.1 EAL domain-containing protein [Sulfurimonas sp. C5]
MNDNISFYKFMHRQILVVIALLVGTSPGYLITGYLYTNMVIELLWFFIILLVSIYGYQLYIRFKHCDTLELQEKWLTKVSYFMFVYFSLWTIMFVYYVMHNNIDMHYMAIATQLGCTVVAATILASQKKLVISTVSSLMLPITIYLLMVGSVYSDILAFFTVVLSLVLLYAAKNTHEYLTKSRFQAYHDYLTGLGNRRYFIEMLDSSVRENRDRFTYLLLIDLDHFKTINDTLGHDVGDQLLIEVSQRMTKLAKKGEHFVARLGGDEFCILSKGFDTNESCLEDAQEFSQELLDEIKYSYNIEGNHLFISSSIGISIINNPKLQANEFLKEADIAMYEAKSNGRDGILIFNDELCKLIEQKLEIERNLHFAVDKNEVRLQYQPQLNVKGQVVGCEVLARWHNEKLGLISPDVFIPIAENTGYILELGEYILERALQTLVKWDRSGIKLRQLSINISMRQFLDKSFVDMVEKLFDRYNIYSFKTQVIFEITETSTSENLKKIVDVINDLRRLGIKFSMDDFGTGYSSLSYLREMPIDELKIDKSFISRLDDEQQALLVKSIIEISRNMNLSIVAEGVEEQYQKDFLEELGCDLYQGYYFYKPLCQEDFEALF